MTLESWKLFWRMASLIPKLNALDSDLKSVQGDQEKEAEIAFKAGIIDVHQFNRLRLLWKFVKLAPQAQIIEKEWQSIQQDEHDAFFAFQIMRGRNEAEYSYKKGVSDGIKWCLNRFS